MNLVFPPSPFACGKLNTTGIGYYHYCICSKKIVLLSIWREGPTGTTFSTIILSNKLLLQYRAHSTFIMKAASMVHNGFAQTISLTQNIFLTSSSMVHLFISIRYPLCFPLKQPVTEAISILLYLVVFVTPYKDVVFAQRSEGEATQTEDQF